MNTTLPLEYLYQEELYAQRATVLVILFPGWNELTEEDQLLLKKIMGSVRLDLAAVQIITRQEFSLQDLENYAPKQIIAFGSVFKGSTARYQLISHEGTAIIQADSLQNLDDPKKKSLWMALKQMFNI
jgi:DNA polymerase III psi subunit